MNKIKLLWNKIPLVTILSMGFMAWGIVCVSWAMYSMWAYSNYSADAATAYSQDSLSTTPPLYSAEGDTVQSDPSLILLAPDKETTNSVYPMEGDSIGSLTIPALKLELPIIQGTGDNDLKKGVGHFIQSVLPGEKDNCVLSGHNDTIFGQIGNLNNGDQLIVRTTAGTFTYEVNGSRIVNKDDKTVIVPTDHAVLTLTTCYPFNNPLYSTERYIVSANLVESKK